MESIYISDKSGSRIVSTESTGVFVSFPVSYNWNTSEYDYIAQFITVPKLKKTIFIKLPLSISNVLNVSNLRYTFNYTLEYDTSPNPDNPETQSISVNFSYTLNEDLVLNLAVLRGFLLPYNQNASTNYNLNSFSESSNHPVILAEYSGPKSIVDEDGGLKYAALYVKNNDIQPGNYWLVLPTKLQVLDNYIPDNRIENIAIAIQEAVLQDAYERIQSIINSGVSVYNYRVDFYTTDVKKQIVKRDLINLIKNNISGGNISYAYFYNINPNGLGNFSYPYRGKTYFLTNRYDVGSYSGFIPPPLAVRHRGSWVIPSNDYHLIYTIKGLDHNGNYDNDFDIKISFSLKGDIFDENTWSSEETLFEEVDWQRLMRKKINIIDTSLGGNTKKGMKTVWVRLKRNIYTSASSQKLTQYALIKCPVHYAGETPVISMVRVRFSDMIM